MGVDSVLLVLLAKVRHAFMMGADLEGLAEGDGLPEVTDLHCEVSTDEYVLWGDVLVQYVLLVDLMQPVQYLMHDEGSLELREPVIEYLLLHSY